MVTYIPKKGDIVWLEFDPQIGKEIQKTRSALVISPQTYNQKTGLALFMPVTSQIKGYPFECLLDCQQVKGAILSDQLRSLDWQARRARYIMTIPTNLWLEIMAKLNALIDSDNPH